MFRKMTKNSKNFVEFWNKYGYKNPHFQNFLKFFRRNIIRRGRHGFTGLPEPNFDTPPLPIHGIGLHLQFCLEYFQHFSYLWVVCWLEIKFKKLFDL